MGVVAALLFGIYIEVPLIEQTAISQARAAIARDLEGASPFRGEPHGLDSAVGVRSPLDGAASGEPRKGQTMGDGRV